MASLGPGLSDSDSDSGDDVEILPRHLNERMTSHPNDDVTLPPRKPTSQSDLSGLDNEDTPTLPISRLSTLPNLPSLSEEPEVQPPKVASSISRSSSTLREKRPNTIRRRHTFAHRTPEKAGDSYPERPVERPEQQPSDLEDMVTAMYFDLDLPDSEDSVLGGLPQSRLELRPEDRHPVDCEAIMLRFDLEKRLGKSTYLVKSRDNKAETFVLRVLDLTGRTEEEHAGVFRTVQSLQPQTLHENLINIHDVVTSEERVYVVTEYCEGGTLQALISRARHFGETLNVIEVCDWLVHILRALAHLHSRSHLHLSPTSGSVFLKNNSAKLGECSELKRLRKSLQCSATPGDGGISEEGPRCPSVLENQAGHKDPLRDQGSRGILESPEVVNGDPPTAKSDIWSAGCLLFELCSQKHPFPYKRREEFLQAVYSKPPPPISELFPEELGHIYSRMVRVDPQERPSADGLLQEDFLREHIEDMDGDGAVWV